MTIITLKDMLENTTLILYTEWPLSFTVWTLSGCVNKSNDSVRKEQFKFNFDN